MARRDQLDAAIKEAGHTQSSVSRALGISRTMINSYVRGATEPTVSTAVQIARLLGRTVEELFWEPRPPENSKRRPGPSKRKK